ncbi:MAG: hypothetical protein ACLR13_04235 [Acutalibacteraceae bacterium]
MIIGLNGSPTVPITATPILDKMSLRFLNHLYAFFKSSAEQSACAKANSILSPQAKTVIVSVAES